jgi:uncharacterized damage-inducible protein DinB
MISPNLLDALLDSWDRNNTILLNLLRAIPSDAFELRPMESSPTIAGLFLHIHYCRLIFVAEDAPEAAVPVPQDEWRTERNRERIAQWLNQSAAVVREAVRGRVERAEPMLKRYDHPILLLQHMIWHEGYHHGQIKLTLKMAGRPMNDDDGSLVTWDLWMDKT